MLIYLDESYDTQNKNWMILGALFNPHSRFLHRRMNDIRASYPFKSYNKQNVIEEKYHHFFSKQNHKAAAKIVDAFFDSTSWFRAVAVDLNICDLNRFGTPEDETKIKEARRYKKFTQLLLRNNTRNIRYATLLVDEMSRCTGDRFIELIRGEFLDGRPDPILSCIEEIDSKDGQYQVLRVCDILTGCIINRLTRPSREWKNKTAEYLCKKIGVRDLTPDVWKSFTKFEVEERFPKYNIWYWEPSK